MAARAGPGAGGDESAPGASLLLPEIILGPVDGCTASNDSSTLLVLAPGAFCQAEEYRRLAVALQESVKDRIRLTVGLVDIKWAGMQPSKIKNPHTLETATALGIERVVEQAGQFLQLKPSGTGRRDNVFLGAHSAMGPEFVRPALESAGGLLLLGSQPLPAVSDTFPAFATWTRPVLNLTGELDGQMLISKQAFAAVEAAGSASRLGLHHTAAFQPVVILPGVNHMQIGPGKEKFVFPGQQPADLEADVSNEEAVGLVAAVMGDFLAAHRAAPARRQAAVEALTAAVIASANLLGPLVKASGRGDVAGLVEALAQEPDLPSKPAASAAGMVLRAVGGEVTQFGHNGKWLAHPGELSAAEEAAEATQRRALGGLPREMLERVIVAATAHTDEATFLYNQPTIQKRPGGRVLVRPHVYLWRHYLETTARVQAAIHPEYAFKLRTSSAVARALGEDEEAEKHLQPAISPSQINDETLQWALQALPEATRARYQRRGKKWKVGVRQIEGERAAPQWVQQEHVTFMDTDDQTTQISAPAICTQKPGEAVPKLADYASGLGRFLGNHYFKVLSPARAMEWLMLDALRPRQEKLRPQMPQQQQL